jgi:hypothetical protein
VGVNDAPLRAQNNLIVDLDGVESAGFTLAADVPFALITRTSFYDYVAVGENGVAAGVHVHGEEAGDIEVSDSIFERMRWSVLAADGAARFDFIATRLVQNDDLEQANFGPNVSVLERNCFELAAGGDFALDPESSCVNAGDPASGCGDEPGGEDCVPDLGHLAGTGEARP